MVREIIKFSYVMAAAVVLGCSPEDLAPPDRVFKSVGHDVEVYSAYEKIVSHKKFTLLVPPGATDIWIWWDSSIGGQLLNFRCRIELVDLQAYARKFGYAFESCDLVRDAGEKGFYLYNPEDAIFSHFPRVSQGNVIGHHADGYLVCSVGGERKKILDAHSLKYVYDVKCKILWCEWWN